VPRSADADGKAHPSAVVGATSSSSLRNLARTLGFANKCHKHIAVVYPVVSLPACIVEIVIPTIRAGVYSSGPFSLQAEDIIIRPSTAFLSPPRNRAHGQSRHTRRRSLRSTDPPVLVQQRIEPRNRPVQVPVPEALAACFSCAADVGPRAHKALVFAEGDARHGVECEPYAPVGEIGGGADGAQVRY
jgi:hypothetical protein